MPRDRTYQVSVPLGGAIAFLNRVILGILTRDSFPQ
jgi:hypothetical protein